MSSWLQQQIETLDNDRRDIEVIHNDRHGKPVTRFFKKGVYACPSVVYFCPSVDLTMRRGWDSLDQFFKIAEHEVAFASSIEVFVVQLVLGNRPYVWRWSQDPEKWRRFAADASWVRAKEVIKFERLKEVTVVVRGQTPLTVIAREWRGILVKRWREELMKVKSAWPARWKGVIPKLTFRKPDFTMLVADEVSAVAV